MSFGLTKAFSKHSGRIIEKWVFDAKSPLVCAATVAELQRGQHSIIFGTKDGLVLCIDEGGNELWRFASGEKLSTVESFFVDQDRVHSIDAPPVVQDVDMDGSPEVLIGSERGIIYCLDAAGKLKWKHDCGGSIRASCAVADVNMDGKPEVLVGSSNNKLTVLTGEGKKVFEYNTDAPVESVPGVLKGQKVLIIFGNSKGTLVAITPAQEVVWRVELDQKITAAPAFFDDPEEKRFAIGTLGGELVCISEHGEIVWTYKTHGSIYSAATVADINDDRKPEILVGSCDNSVYAITAEGQKIWSYETDFWVTTTPLVTDIDQDGKLEVIIGSYDHNVYILDSMGTYVLDYVPGLSGIVHQSGTYSSILTSDPGEQTGKKLYQFRTEGIVVGCALLPREKPALIVNVKSGHVTGLRHEE